MRRKSVFLATLISVFVVNIVNAQDVKSYFISSLDSIVAQLNVPGDDKEADSDPVFYKLFSPTLLYSSTIKDAVSLDDGAAADAVDGKLALDEEREEFVDRLLVGVYKNYPSYITATESDIRGELVTSDF